MWYKLLIGCRNLLFLELRSADMILLVGLTGPIGRYPVFFCVKEEITPQADYRTLVFESLRTL